MIFLLHPLEVMVHYYQLTKKIQQRMIIIDVINDFHLTIERTYFKFTPYTYMKDY